MVPFTSVESDDHIQMTLKSVLDLTLAEALHQNFLDVLTTGKTINIMAGDVDRITTPCLQIMLALKNRAMQEKITFSIAEMSDAFQAALKETGLDSHLIDQEQAT